MKKLYTIGAFLLFALAIALPASAQENDLQKKLEEAVDNLRNQVEEGKNQIESNILEGSIQIVTNIYSVIIEFAENRITVIRDLPNLTDAEKQLYVDEHQKAIDYFEDATTDAKNAETQAELSKNFEAAKSFNQSYVTNLRTISGDIWRSRIDDLAAKYREAGSTIEGYINDLALLGVDTENLEALLADYNAHIDDAEAKADAAVNKIESATTFQELGPALDEARLLLEQSAEDLEQAYAVIEEMIQEVQNADIKAVSVAGEGQVYAVGVGNAVLEGNGGVTIESLYGTITIEDNGGDANINLSGEPTETNGNTVIYRDYNGTGTISGSDIKVALEGEVDFHAGGVGRATLRGEGKWWIEDMVTKLDWPSEAIEIQIQ